MSTKNSIMRMTMLLLAFLTCASLGAIEEATVFEFYNGDFISAKSKAGEEGKLFFVDFYATWCAPCKWMEESTFKDKEVISLLSQNYVAMKVDIDDLDGYSIKQKYQVHILPTILIFNSKGELVERIEETVSSRKMAAVLKHHNKEENKVKFTHSLNSSPRKTNVVVTSNYNAVTKTPRINKAITSNSNGMQSYKVQLGVYKEFENTYDLVNKIKSEFLEPIIVLNDMRNGKVIYRVLMGDFATHSEATDFKAILEKDFNIKSIVK